MSIYCYYHRKDLDGLCSANIVKRKFPNAQFIGYDYGDKINTNKYFNDTLILVDCSFPIDVMLKLSKLNKMIWIDHHISAIKEAEEKGLRVDGLRDTNYSACFLTYKFFFNTNVPFAIRLLSDYDIWNNKDEVKWNEEILPFQYFVKSKVNKFQDLDFLWDMSNQDYEKQIEIGKTILNYQEKENEKYAKLYSFEAYVNDLPAVCINSNFFSSNLFNTVYDSSVHKLMLCYCFDGKKFKYSIYSTHSDVDCSVIAKRLGGGGHKGAAGWESKNFYFDDKR